MRKPAVVASLLLGALILSLSPIGSLAQTYPTPAATPSPSALPSPSATATLTPAPSSTPEVAPAAAPDVSSPSPTPLISGLPNVPCATDDPSNERVSRSERHGIDDDDDGNPDPLVSGNGRNEVIVHNCTDNRLRVRAAIQLNTIPGHVVKPINDAFAEGSCTSCQTLAVALQIDVYSGERAGDVEPQNYAVALNTNCTDCVTVARALQYVQPSDDPRDVSQDISDAVDAMQDELTAIQSDPTISLADAEARLNAVLVRFTQLGGSLGDQRQERDD